MKPLCFPQKKTSNHSSKIPQEHQRTTPCSSSGPSQMPQIDLIGAKGDDRCCCNATRPLVRSSVQNGEDDAEHNTLGASRTKGNGSGVLSKIPWHYESVRVLGSFSKNPKDWQVIEARLICFSWVGTCTGTKVYPSKYVTTKKYVNAVKPYVYLNHIFLLYKTPCFVFTSPSVLNKSQHFCPPLVALTMAAARVMTSTTWSPSKEVQYNRLPPCSGIIVDPGLATKTRDSMGFHGI